MEKDDTFGPLTFPGKFVPLMKVFMRMIYSRSLSLFREPLDFCGGIRDIYNSERKIVV
jgi:hypothetical protein